MPGRRRRAPPRSGCRRSTRRLARSGGVRRSDPLRAGSARAYRRDRSRDGPASRSRTRCHASGAGTARAGGKRAPRPVARVCCCRSRFICLPLLLSGASGRRAGRGSDDDPGPARPRTAAAPAAGRPASGTRGETAAGTARIGGSRRQGGRTGCSSRRQSEAQDKPEPGRQVESEPEPELRQAASSCRRTNSRRCWIARHWRCRRRRSNHCRRTVTGLRHRRATPAIAALGRGGRACRPSATSISPFLSRWYGRICTCFRPS